MNRENLILLLVLGVGGLALAIWAATGQTSRGYYRVNVDGVPRSLSMRQAEARLADLARFGLPTEAEARFRAATTIAERDAILAALEVSPALRQELRQQYLFEFSWARTIGLWVAAFFTLGMLSFLYRDNAWYKIAEHAFVGISAAYWMIVGFWSQLVPNMIGKLFPRWTKFNLQPGLDLDDIAIKLDIESWLRWVIDYHAAAVNPLGCHWWQLMNWFYWVPVILGIMLLWRLAPTGTWIARWPLAYVIGTTAGLRLVAYLEADFVLQIAQTVVPLVQLAYDPVTGAIQWGKSFYNSLNHTLLVLGVVCSLLYFFFSVEHRGFVGKASRVGIWVLMITFGAGFGYTVMGRVALLVGRFEFLLEDWLNLVKT
ncbi:MAG: hypothetical protein IPM18_07910 [Phycisphaerales bacterium]|nr:hypothetical protein [Phycisphaerales bacterium]